jgi:hypothetical protein
MQARLEAPIVNTKEQEVNIHMDSTVCMCINICDPQGQVLQL